MSLRFGGNVICSMVTWRCNGKILTSVQDRASFPQGNDESRLRSTAMLIPDKWLFNRASARPTKFGLRYGYQKNSHSCGFFCYTYLHNILWLRNGFHSSAGKYVVFMRLHICSQPSLYSHKFSDSSVTNFWHLLSVRDIPSMSIMLHFVYLIFCLHQSVHWYPHRFFCHIS